MDNEKIELNDYIDAALMLAFEAGRWLGQVDLEEHYDRFQYSQVFSEAINSRKTSMPQDMASEARTVRVNLRSGEWREGVKKRVKEYFIKAQNLAKNTAYEQINTIQ